MMSVELVTRVIETLERNGIPYMVVGSFSSNSYGRPRSTKDADLVVELGGQSISQAMAGLGSDVSIDPQMSFESITSTLRYKLFHKATAFTVEIFLLSDDPHDRKRFERRVRRDLGNDKSAWLPTAEDVVITKLRWSKQGRRPKDVEDARDVLAVQSGKLDLPYIRQWADVHGTRELFEKLLVEIQRLA